MSVSQNTVLFIDDDVTAAKAIVQSLRRRSYEFDTLFAVSETDALEQLTVAQPEAVVLDLSLSVDRGPAGGLELIESIQTQDASVRMLVLTGHDSREFGVESLKRGAASFLSKPVDVEHLGILLRDAILSTSLKRGFMRLSSTPEALRSVPGFSSRSDNMKPVLEAVAYASSNNQPVLLIGETGVGKGVIAQAIHQGSTRKNRPFIRVQPRFGSHDLTASEIFGHEKGAFTGALQARKGLIEEASGGTLFLDEVDELPLETQVQLLNTLQERTFRKLGANREIRSDFRLITATNRSLDDSLREGKIRLDFYHRVAHVTIDIPPLRDRADDIPELANDCLRRLGNRENLGVHGFSPDAMEKLLRYQWPGNVRELFAIVEGGAYRAQFEGRRFVEASDLVLKKNSGGSALGSFRDQVRQFEIRLIQEALVRCGNNQSRAAEQLQLDRSTLARLLNRRSR